jgi:hypothetical protein
MGSSAQRETPVTDDGLTVPRLPLATQIKYRLIAFMLQTFIIAPANFLRTWKASRLTSGVRPDMVKNYPCRKGLPVR